MDIFIAKGGERLGPYSLAQLQGMVDTDEVLLSDLAWHEGQPNWIRLADVPGFFHRPSAPAIARRFTRPSRQERPALVWVICILSFFFESLQIFGLSHLLIFLTQSSLPRTVGYAQIIDRQLVTSATGLTVVTISLTTALLLLIGNIFLFSFTQAGPLLLCLGLYFGVIEYGALD